MNPYDSPKTDTTNRIGVDLPPCPVRTIIGGKHIHCGHSAMHTELALYPGAKAGIVSATACRKCKILTWPCETPKPPPTMLGVGGLLISFNFWRWGRAVKRLVRWTTFGTVRPQIGCGCPEREIMLDRWGAKVSRVWRRVKRFLLP